LISRQRHQSDSPHHLVMIIRVFRATPRAGKGPEFEQKARSLSVPLVKKQKGLLAFFPGKPLRRSDAEFIMITVWDSLESLKAFAGSDFTAAVIPPEELPLIESTSVEHYAAYEDSSAGSPELSNSC
jgi:heme-degrading monooxygenase HmoA